MTSTRGITPPPQEAGTLSLTAVERWSFIGYDLAATHRFYTEVLLRPLVYAQTADYLPGSDEYAPHIEVRYALDDGSTINFIVFRASPPDSARPAQSATPLRIRGQRHRNAACLEGAFRPTAYSGAG